MDPPRRGPDWAKVAIVLLVAAGVAAFFVLGGPKWLNLATLKAHRAALLDYTHRHYAAVVAVSVVAYVVVTALSLPDAIILSLAMGFVFGPWVGTLLVVPAATAGSTLAFLGARYLFADAARRKMGPRLRRFAEGFGENGFSYMLFLRLVPVFPFMLVNLAPAFTPLKPRTFLAATALGIVPGSFVYCWLGAQLSTLQSLSDVYREPRWLAALGLLAALSLAPVVWKKVRPRPQPGASA
jgi:uncharacterized membrane protein YdjX (TVP38/TMEM64 family)